MNSGGESELLVSDVRCVWWRRKCGREWSCVRVVVRGLAVAYQHTKKDEGITTTPIMITVRGEDGLIWLFHLHIVPQTELLKD